MNGLPVLFSLWESHIFAASAAKHHILYII